MDYKLIVCDLDGTLLNSSSKLSEYTKRILRKLTVNIPLIIATARAPRDVKEIITELKIDRPCIFYNGALIYEMNCNRRLFSCGIPSSVLEPFLLKLESNRYVNDYLIEKNNSYWINENEDVDIKKWVQMGEPPVGVGHYLSFTKEPVSKIIISGNHSEIINLIQKDYSKILAHTYSDSKQKWLEILSYGVSKAWAVQFIAKHMGIPLSQIIAFGDADNDIKMLQTVGRGIAMANSTTKVKSLIKETALSNNDDGVARKLSDIFFI